MQPGPEATGGGSCIINPDKRSRATVKLNSTDVRDPPSVDTNMLAQEEEVERMVMCLEKERLYYEGLRGLGFNITESLPGEGVDLKEAVRLQRSDPISYPHLNARDVQKSHSYNWDGFLSTYARIHECFVATRAVWSCPPRCRATKVGRML
jgi:hypothetical protein